MSQDQRQPGAGSQHDVSAVRKQAEQTFDQQRRLYEGVLSTTPDLAYVFDLNHRFIYANEGLLKMWGKTRDEAIGKKCLELGYEPWHAEMHGREIDQVVATKQPVRGVVPFTGTFGRRLYDYILTPVLDANGEVEAVAGITRDVTDIKRTEEALRESEERFRALTDAAADVVYRMSADWTQMCLLRGREFVADTIDPGHTWLDKYIPADDKMLVVEQINRAIESKSTFQLEHRVIREDGSIGWTYSRAIPILDDNGKIVEWFGTASDVTNRKQAEANLLASHDTFRQLVENSPFGVYVIDADFRLAMVSAGAQHVFKSISPLLGRDYAQVLRIVWPEPTASNFIALFRNTLLTGEPYRSPRTVERRADINETEAYDWKIERIVMPDGRHGVVCHFYDLSERQRWEAALRESEDRYRAVVENQTEMLCRFRSDGTILFVNSAYARSCGTTPDALMGVNFWEFVAEEHRSAVRGMLAGMTLANPQVRVENRFNTVDGPRWTLWTNHALAFDAEGRWTEAQSTGLDITDRKRAEETIHALLRISERLNSTLEVEALLDILVAEAIQLVNAESGVAGLRTTEGLACKKYLQNGRELKLEYCWPPMHGLPGWLLVNKAPYITNHAAADPQIVQELVAQFGVHSAISTPIITAQGEVVGFFEIHNKRDPAGFTSSDRDLLMSVSQVAAIAVQNALAYRSVQDAEESLKEADRRKDEFLAVLAHELRNPLAPIRTGLQIIQLCDDDPDTAADTVRVMDRQLQQLVRLIDDLLDISRITRGKIELRRESCDLATILSSAVEGSRPVIEEAGVELTITVPRQDVELNADPARLAQVFSNLLTNAAKYTDRGGHIWLTAEQLGSEVLVTVRDTGIGIRPEMLSRIFEIFTQVDRTERSHGGLGIGLSLVRALVDMHGGTVEAHSDGPGQGSEFRVRLPYVVPAAQSHTPTTGPAAESTRCCRVLVVDDNHDAARTLSLLLRRMGHDVNTAHDGLEAIAAAEAFGPDLVLLDLGMPNLNGFEAAQRIRNTTWGKSMTLVALTGWGQEADRRKTKEAGFDAHLVKPVSMDDLEKLIANVRTKSFS